MKNILIALSLFLGVVSAIAQNTNPNIVTTRHIQEYVLMCDTSGLAPFIEGINGTSCIYLERTKWIDIKNSSTPCDDTLIEGILGRACHNTKHLRINGNIYLRTTVCDTSKTADLLQGTLGIRACTDTYENISN